MNADSRCSTCHGSREVPVGMDLDYDSGLWDCDDVIPCPNCLPTPDEILSTEALPEDEAGC